MSEIINLKEFDVYKLKYYSQYNFLRDLSQESLFETILMSIEKDYNNKLIELVDIYVNGVYHLFVIKKLDWDTKYFGFNNYRIELVLYKHTSVNLLRKAIIKLLEKDLLVNSYVMVNVPSEDITLLQALGNTPFKLVETRLNYYLDGISNFENERYKVRYATVNDIPNLVSVAKKSRNIYDRIHADLSFTSEMADDYLGTFAEESVKGFADFVLVPDVPDLKPFGFLACNNPVQVYEKRIAKLVLAAVDNSVERGWLYKLLVEVIYKLKSEGCDILTTITQSANRPAIHIWERAGFKLAFTTHIFTVKLDD